MRLGRPGTSTSSSGFSRTSTAASTPLLSVRVNRTRKPVDDPEPPLGELYYRAVIAPSNETWDMLTQFSNCELAGKGSYGEVVRATSPNGEVAVKRVDILEDDQASDWENGVRLVREIFFLKRLHHPNLSKLETLFPNNPARSPFAQIHIVTRFCKDGSLNTFAPKSLKELVSIQQQICAGLACMHTHNVLHRDIKRENIFIHRRGPHAVHAVIGDFGLSRSQVASGMTAEVVTKPYRCPSLLLGETRYGPEIDVYAAGLVLLEMLIGKLNATLLPNRKMGLRSFLRFQVALGCGWDTEELEGFQLSDRMTELSERMHVDLEELHADFQRGTDFDDKLAQEWSKQTWDNVTAVYLPPAELLGVARRLVSFDPLQRAGLGELTDVLGKIGNSQIPDMLSTHPTVVVRERFDQDISALATDEERAAAVKQALWSMLLEDQQVGPRLAFSEPISKRTRSHYIPR